MKEEALSALELLVSNLIYWIRGIFNSFMTDWLCCCFACGDRMNGLEFEWDGEVGGGWKFEERGGGKKVG